MWTSLYLPWGGFFNWHIALVWGMRGFFPLLFMFPFFLILLCFLFLCFYTSLVFLVMQPSFWSASPIFYLRISQMPGSRSSSWRHGYLLPKPRSSPSCTRLGLRSAPCWEIHCNISTCASDHTPRVFSFNSPIVMLLHPYIRILVSFPTKDWNLSILYAIMPNSDRIQSLCLKCGNCNTVPSLRLLVFFVILPWPPVLLGPELGLCIILLTVEGCLVSLSAVPVAGGPIFL